jgi:hypothetical protein
MSKPIRFAVSRTGRIDYLDHGQLNLDGRVERRRASHVEPTGFWKRLGFRIVRLCFSDDSRAAEWSRGWRTPWRVNLGPVLGPIRGPFQSRAEAIEYEERWLLDNRMGLDVCKVCGQYITLYLDDEPPLLVCEDCAIFAKVGYPESPVQL